MVILQTLQAAAAHFLPDWVLQQPAGYTGGVWDGLRTEAASSGADGVGL